MLTDVFGVQNTGKRTIKNLAVNFIGSIAPQFSIPINITNSTIGSKVLTIGGSSKMHLDSPGQELSFTGNSNIVNSFTFGFYLYGPDFLPDKYNYMWKILSDHAGDSYVRIDSFLTFNFKRLHLDYKTISGSYDWYSWDIPESKWFGWFHVAFTYDMQRNNLTGFIDGVPFASFEPGIWQLKGDSGGSVLILYWYALYYFYILLMLCDKVYVQSAFTVFSQSKYK